MNRKSVVAGTVVAVLILMAVALMGAGEGGAVTLQNPQSILAGTALYTSTYTMTGVYVGGYGSTQWHLGVVVTGTQATTATIQYSNYTGNCSSATAWVSTVHVPDANGYAYGTVSTTVPLSMSASAIYQLPNFGRCTRVVISSDDLYTPTVYIRMLNSFR